jgi:hypothetical protein
MVAWLLLVPLVLVAAAAAAAAAVRQAAAVRLKHQLRPLVLLRPRLLTNHGVATAAELLLRVENNVCSPCALVLANGGTGRRGCAYLGAYSE